MILPHVARVLFPPLSNQFILMTLGTSMAAIFGVEELTGQGVEHQCPDFSLDRGILDRRARVRCANTDRLGDARPHR